MSVSPPKVTQVFYRQQSHWLMEDVTDCNNLSLHGKFAHVVKGHRRAG
jgi:hypothetical protein